MKKLKSPNPFHFIFFLIVVADVFFLYNLIQYIRYGLDTHLNGLIISLGIGIMLLIYLWNNNYFPKQDKPVTNQISKNEPTNKMKKYLKEWWTVYAVGVFSGLITLKKPDYWWVYILIFSFLIFSIDQYFKKDKKKDSE